MSNDNWQAVDSEASIDEFLKIAGHLHDSCVTSVEFAGGRFVDDQGAMHCGPDDRASVILKFDRQSGMRSVMKCVLSFGGVSFFDFDHYADDDGIIFSCSVSLVDGLLSFRCNPSYERPTPAVDAKSFRYRVVR